MTHRAVWSLLSVLSVLLTGCAGAPSAGAPTVTPAPVSQQEAVGDSRQRAKAHTELGMLYLRQGRLNVALDEARVAIESDASYPLGYNLLALVQMTLKDNKAAEENFGRAIRLAPTDPEVNNNYGWFLCQTERERQSFDYFETAGRSALYDAPTKPLTNAGICALAISDDKAAEGYLLRAMRLDPANSEAQFLLADICYRTGRLNEAKMRLADVHRLNEPSPQTTWLGLRVERKLGDREAETRFAAQLRRKFQESREYQLLMQGRFE